MSDALAIANLQLLKTLRDGGCVLVMRHVNIMNRAPTLSEATAENEARECQLDELGTTSARVVGDSIRQLQIPIDEVFTGTTYRARHTANLAGFSQSCALPELDDAGDSSPASLWLRLKIGERSPAGANIMLVTHMANIVGYVLSEISSVALGEMLVCRPGTSHYLELIARVRVERWAHLTQLASQDNPPPNETVAS